jgi:hypothetical protein
MARTRRKVVDPNTEAPRKRKRRLSPRSNAGAPRVGRQIANVVVWCGILYMAAVGFATVIPQVFAPEAVAMPGVSCTEGVIQLRSELLGRGGEQLSGAPLDDTGALRRWLDDWDRRHAGLERVCTGHGARALARLDVLRQQMETTMRRFERDQAPLLHEIDRELNMMTDSSTRGALR